MPVFGTMAHSFIMSFPKEIDAFRAFVKTFPERSILLVDTYNNIAGTEKAALIAKELEAKGYRLAGVRIDSGNIAEISRKTRNLLDSKGLNYVKIFASGDLDEYRIEELLNSGAEIDSFGVGTRMGASVDQPYLDVIYKISETLNEYDKFLPIMKLSEGKSTLPGRKQVFRFKNSQGNFSKDIIALAAEDSEGQPLLQKTMENGKRISPSPTLLDIRRIASENMSLLPAEYKKITNPSIYPVELSTKLTALVRKLRQQIAKKEIETAAA
jgi:nicotinate phosphoribosyltransferase